MVPYNYSVADAVLAVFAAAPKRQRQELLRVFDFLAKETFTEGNATQADHSGRSCQVNRFGAWMVTYWPEHLANKIHILDVERLV